MCCFLKNEKDTPEIGDAIIDELLVDALLYLNRYKDGQVYSHDVMRSMNLVIDQLQPQMLWDFTCQLFGNDAVVRVAAIHRTALRHANNNNNNNNILKQSYGILFIKMFLFINY